MNKSLTFLLALTFLFLFSCSQEIEVKKEYWDDGKLKSEIYYKDGKREGLATWWHKNGQKGKERHYKDGKIEGLTTSWYPSGEKKSEIHYKDGKREGLPSYSSGEKKE